MGSDEYANASLRSDSVQRFETRFPPHFDDIPHERFGISHEQKSISQKGGGVAAIRSLHRKSPLSRGDQLTQQ